ncbi:MAG: Clp1/GlmU family protein [Gammaproteobacteria bacterium]
MDESRAFALLSCREAVERLCDTACRVLVTGAPGTGKSTLVARLGKTLAAHGLVAQAIGADPGPPAFAIPGAVCLVEWRDDNWHILSMEPLCSLDAARFRLPLVGAVRRLMEQQHREGALLVDTPGVVRGVAGAELLTGLCEASKAEVVIVLVRDPEKPPLDQELAALDAEVWFVQPAAEACRPNKRHRDRARTARWDAYLQDAQPVQVDLEKAQRLGSPPPLDAPDAWQGRQVALGDGSVADLRRGAGAQGYCPDRARAAVFGRGAPAHRARRPARRERLPGNCAVIRQARAALDSSAGYCAGG